MNLQYTNPEMKLSDAMFAASEIYEQVFCAFYEERPKGACALCALSAAYAVKTGIIPQWLSPQDIEKPLFEAFGLDIFDREIPHPFENGNLESLYYTIIDLSDSHEWTFVQIAHHLAYHTY